MSNEELGCIGSLLSTVFAIVGLIIVFGAMAYSAKAVHYVSQFLDLEGPTLGTILTFGLWGGGLYLIYRLAKSKMGT